ncbi:MAG: hydantoinase B/oxoprolinase family protein [Candidatus Caldarchaeum sp.]
MRNLVEMEIVRNSLIAISEEMFTVTAKTSKSPIIYDVLDFSTGLTDANGDVVSQATGIPLFIGMLDFNAKAPLTKFGRDGLQPGDIIIVNDPYISGTHLNDVAIVAPFFHKDELLALGVNKGHYYDIGGMVFGSWGPKGSEVYQEGVLIPPVKLYDEGELNKDVLDLLLENSRLPSYVLGDIEAQTASMKLAERRLQNLVAKYSLDTVTATMEKILRDGEAVAWNRLKTLPKGQFKAEDYYDDSGTSEEPMKLMVKVEISDDKFDVDLSGNPPAVRAAINTTYPATVAAVRIVYAAVLDPHVRYNQGFVKPLSITIPENTIFNAKKPYPVGIYWETMTYAADLVWKALAPHIPDRLTAGHFLSVVAETIAGINPRNKESFALVEPNPGGWGAGYDKDGESALVSFADGETFITSVEVIEQRYPIIVERYQLNIEDGVGHGRFRGGFGIVKDYRLLADAEFTTAVNRSKFPPWGVEGGLPGTYNYMVIERADGTRTRVRKVSGEQLKAGDLVSIRTAGGGGWGDPKTRDPEKVREDVVEGYITVEQARKIYGVVFKPNLEIDWEATRLERTKS